MALPVVTKPEDIESIVNYLITKPTGATLNQVKAVLGSKIIDGRRIATFQALNIIVREGERIKLTTNVGRALGRASNDEEFSRILSTQIASIPAYKGILEWAYHNGLSELTASEVGAHWHEHYREELSTDNDKEISHRAVCFLQLSAGAGLGQFIVGRRGQESRLGVLQSTLEGFVTGVPSVQKTSEVPKTPGVQPATEDVPTSPPSVSDHRQKAPELGQALFIAHGKNKKPLEQLKNILDGFKVQYKVAVDKPNLGRPISTKVRETMEECNCAILIFTADEEFTDKDSNAVWRPSENIIYELGAASYLYGKRIVIMKEDKVDLPTDFKDIGYISFSKDKLGDKAMDIIKELIGFNILKVVT